MDSINFKAQFFLPDSHTRKVYGTVEYTNEKGINVDLIGVLSGALSHYPIILGETSFGQSFTLFDTLSTQFTFSTGGFSTSKLHSKYLFRGLHFQSAKDLYFRRLRSGFNLLTDWLNIRKNFDIEIDTIHRTTKIQEKPPEKLEFQLPNNFKLEIHFFANSKMEGNPIKEVNIKQETYIEIKSIRRERLDLLLDLLQHFQNFLTFISLKTTYPQDVEILFKTQTIRSYNKAELFFQISYMPNYLSNKLYPDEFLIPFVAIESKFHSIIYKWFMIREKLNPIISEFCSIYYTSQMYPEDKFLSIARCLESFHREFKNPNKIALERYKDLYKEGRTSFNKILKVGSSIKFCEKIRDIRNSLTHNNSTWNKGTRKSKELFQITEKAKIIFIAAILKELGLDNKEIKHHFEHTTTIQKKF